MSSACSTRRWVKRQQLQLLTDEESNLKQLDQFISAHPNPEIESQASIFVSKSAIDQVLRAADKFEIPIKQINGAVFHIDTIQSKFRNNFPIVEIVSWVEDRRLGIKVDLNTYAELETIKPDNDPAHLHFLVKIKRVEPVVHVGIFHFRTRWLAYLIHKRMQEYADGLPDFNIPIRSDMPFNAGATEQSMQITSPDGHVDGILKIPGYAILGSLIIDQVLYLQDGIHVLVSTTVTGKKS